ncbi:C6 finger domain-containing protein [Colletotrichum karsti]|uniref:C6 finger domain-containing protein n=1 Tax=Colletotrichum karsti TaxID=1095194 RepID=A0A9P6I1D3_9PEZI|nr:C6 finger domain-containing protein [Colletotrichum karsti]KAF9873056.1 C6 finger domain-containing protein [Colletotrichum karsti]
MPDSTASTSSFVPPVRSDAVFNECYSLFHLDLLHHFQGPLTNVTVSIQSELARILRVTYTEALRAPYLMDEVLAFASAHKSTVAQDSDSKALYQNESTRLQTRAISQLSLTNEDVNEDNFLPLFAFSLLLGQHVLFDVFSNPTSLTSVIDRFVQFLGLHHGISMITSQSIDRFTGLLQDLVPTDPVHFQVKVASLGRGTECQGLLQRLSESDLSESTKSVYADAVKILQYLFDTLESSDSRRYVAVQEWPVRISQDYISLLQQRRPEALVIMGYYAVLLHRAKDYWPVGDSGRFLIKVISNHLGSYWSDLLEWPNQELGLDET